jgi:hypothetical protein
MDNVITLALREIGTPSNNGETVELRFEVRDGWANEGEFYMIVTEFEAGAYNVGDIWAGKMVKLP